MSAVLADLRSDNVSPACDAVLRALMDANERYAGAAAWAVLEALFQESLEAVFGAKVEAAPVLTGTAANAMALALADHGGRLVICHEHAHVRRHEDKAYALFAPTSRLVPIAGRNGKLSPEEVVEAFRRCTRSGGGHMLTVANSTELGTVYDPDEIAALARIAHDHGSFLHVDGARFAHAAVALGVPPADLAARAGVDVLSLGFSKIGAVAADAVVVFSDPLKGALARLRKRAGHANAKRQALIPQILALFEDDLWLRYGRQANRAAARLARLLTDAPGIGFAAPVEANQLFLDLPSGVAERLAERGYPMRLWFEPSIYRVVTAFDTPESAIEDFARAVTAVCAAAWPQQSARS